MVTSQRRVHDCKQLLQWWTSQLWRGDHTLPVSSQGVKILGSPVGHPGYVSAQLQEKSDSHSVLLDRIPAMEDLQAAWLLLLFCAQAKANFLLRSVHPDSTLQYATRHDNRCWECLCRILRVSSEVGITSQQIASLPSQLEVWGLHSAVLVRHAAYWSSWADCVHMVNKRHPQISRSILRSIATDNPPHHIDGVSISEAALRLSGFHPPSWEELAEGLRPGRRAIEDEDRTQPRFGWQKLAAESLQLDFRENVLMPSLPGEKRALLRSQSGPFSSTPFVAFPTTKATTFDPQPFRVLMLRRVHLPLPLSTRNCRCGRPLNCLGHHRSACAVAGVLGRRGFPLECSRACVLGGRRPCSNERDGPRFGSVATTSH